MKGLRHVSRAGNIGAHNIGVPERSNREQAERACLIALDTATPEELAVIALILPALVAQVREERNQ